VISSNNDGKSWYNAGQFSLQKRFSGSNTIQMSYTWSKWLQATEYLNPSDPEPTRMLADQDSPHRFTMSGIWELPFGKGKPFANDNGVLDRIVGGWQLQGVYTFQVGFPVAFGSFNITSGATSGDIFYIGGPVDQSSSYSALPVPTGHLRTFPYRFDEVRRDNINNFDFSLMKNTRITETMKFQIRLEAVNAFNHPYFPAGSTTLGDGFLAVAGTVSNQANYARRIQIGFKFLF
jgi:hypothetical protein